MTRELDCNIFNLEFRMLHDHTRLNVNFFARLITALHICLRDLTSRDQAAQNTQDLRCARGLSQKELALRAGVNRGYMVKLENSQYAMSVVILEKIANALSVEPSELVAPRR